MLIPLLPQRTRAWLLAAMAVVLLGVQVLQFSPLHNHTLAVDDCALCHLQPLGDDSEHEQALPETQLLAITVALVDHSSTPQARSHTPYQGRAPPFLSL